MRPISGTVVPAPAFQARTASGGRLRRAARRGPQRRRRRRWRRTCPPPRAARAQRRRARRAQRAPRPRQTQRRRPRRPRRYAAAAGPGTAPRGPMCGCCCGAGVRGPRPWPSAAAGTASSRACRDLRRFEGARGARKDERIESGQSRPPGTSNAAHISAGTRRAGGLVPPFPAPSAAHSAIKKVTWVRSSFRSLVSRQEPTRDALPSPARPHTRTCPLLSWEAERWMSAPASWCTWVLCHKEHKHNERSTSRKHVSHARPTRSGM
jgi:hypothetical protein